MIPDGNRSIVTFMNIRRILILTGILTVGVLQPDVVRGQGSMAARLATEVAEALARRGGARAAEVSTKELAALGGHRAVVEVLEHAGREGGEGLMRAVAEHAGRHGVLALQAFRGAPGAVIRAFDGVSTDVAEGAMRALVREPAAVQALIRNHGVSALEAAARHPGLAVPIGNRLGAEGLDIARRLTTDEAVVLSRHADALAAMPGAGRSQMLAFIRQAPAKSLAWMEKHPRLVLAGSATAVITAARKEIFGEADRQGLLERAVAAAYRTFETPVNTALGVIAVVGATWMVWKVRGLCRFRRARRA